MAVEFGWCCMVSEREGRGKGEGRGKVNIWGRREKVCEVEGKVGGASRAGEEGTTTTHQVQSKAVAVVAKVVRRKS